MSAQTAQQEYGALLQALDQTLDRAEQAAGKLAERHQMLRQAANGALSDLERLIDTEELWQEIRPGTPTAKGQGA